EHFAIFPVKRSQGFRQPLPHFLSFQRFRRNLTPVGEVSWGVIPFLVGMLSKSFHDYRPISASAHESLVHRDLNQPRAEACFGPELLNMGEGLQHRLLTDILSVRFIPQDG